jgi:acyl carrier protein
MDAFAHSHLLRSELPILSVNWDHWGVQSNELLADVIGGSVTEFFMSPEEGCEAVERVLSVRNLPQLVNSTGDLHDRLEKWITRRDWDRNADAADASRTSAHPRPQLPTPFVAARNEVEKQVATIWAEMLGLDEVGIYDNFLELGGHSLLATQIMSRLRGALRVDVPIRVLFEQPTVAGLAAALSSYRAVEGAPIPALTKTVTNEEELLKSLEHLSDDEVDSLLQQMLSEEELAHELETAPES